MHSNYRSTSPPPPARPRSPTSSYALATSRSHTGIGGASGLLNSSFSPDEPYSQSVSGVRRSPTAPYRSTFSPPRVPLFEDLPPHLYSRYADSQDYLSRQSRNTFTPGRRLAAPTSSTAASYLSPSSGYSSIKDWNSPSSYTPARSYTSTSAEPSPSTAGFSRTPSPYSTSPNSTKSVSPVPSYSTHIVHDPATRPFSPTHTPSQSAFEYRPISPQPVVFVRASAPFIWREEIMAGRGIAVGHNEVGPDTQQLIEESEAITRDLDQRIDQSDRFIQEVDEKLGHTDSQRTAPSQRLTTKSTPRPRSWNIAEEKENQEVPARRKDDGEKLGQSPERHGRDARRRRDISSGKDADDDWKMSVLEVEIGGEDDLVKALRKSAERMTASPKLTDKRKHSQHQEPVTDVHQRRAGSTTTARYEDTVSSYELRMREAKKPEENVFKKYMPAIIGGAVVLFIIILLMSSMKPVPKSKTVIKQPVKLDVDRDVCKEFIKKSKVTAKITDKHGKGRADEISKATAGISGKSAKTATKPVDKSKAKASEKVLKNDNDQLSGPRSKLTDPARVKGNKTIKHTTGSMKASNVTGKLVPKSKNVTIVTTKSAKKAKAAKELVNMTTKAAATKGSVKTAKQKAGPSDAATVVNGTAGTASKKAAKAVKDCVEEVKPAATHNRAAKPAMNATAKAARKVMKKVATNATMKGAKKDAKK